jgi:homocysteine S-methyltransferase
MTKFMEALEQRVLVCDGAMGTMLYSRGVFINKSFDAMNLTQAHLVEDVHHEYVRAGADIIETNTFGANRIKLASFGLGDKLHEINAEGARIARRAAGDRAYVAGSIGPLGIRIEPWGKTGIDEAKAYFREQAEGLFAGGVDLFILETFRDLNEIGAAIDAVRSVCDLPIIAQMTTEEDGNTLDGTPPERFAPELEKRGATIIGVNCAVGPAPMLETIERMQAVTTVRLSAQPNAGKPRDVEGRNIYLCSPEYMASYARRFILHNVRVVGGCCGTTPEHIRQIKAAVRVLVPSAVTAPSEGRVAVRQTAPIMAPPIPLEQKSRLARQLAHGEFVLGVELLPPRGFEAEPAIQRARELKRYGVDVVNVPVARGSGRAAGRHRNAAALLLPRSQPARYPVRPVGRPLDGIAQSAAHYRRPRTRW